MTFTATGTTSSDRATSSVDRSTSPFPGPYLAHIAFAMHVAGTPGRLTCADFERAHSDYLAKHDVKLPLERALADLSKRSVLLERDGRVAFRYSYLYYFFVAARLRDMIDEESIRATIVKLSRTLHLEESANVLLFLAHLTRNRFVIDTMLQVARSHWTELTPARLEAAEVVGEADAKALAAATLVYLEGDPETARRESFAEMDETAFDAEVAEERGSFREPVEVIHVMGRALKSLQILGQIAKNFPGSLTGDRKLEIVSECYALGGRILGWFYSVVRLNQIELTQLLAALIRQQHPSYHSERLISRAQEAYSRLVAMVTFGMVKRVSTSVGSPDLSITYDRVAERSPLVSMFDVSIRLDHEGEFPMETVQTLASDLAANDLALVVLRGLVVQHFHLFKVDYRRKQAACVLLAMKYESAHNIFPSTKLLPE